MPAGLVDNSLFVEQAFLRILLDAMLDLQLFFASQFYHHHVRKCQETDWWSPGACSPAYAQV